MNSTLKLALVAATAVVAGIACSPVAVAPSPAVTSPPPKPSPSLQAATVAPTPTPNLLETSTWTTYVSRRYGFSIAHPADWNEDPADHDWSLAKDAANPVNTGAEHFALPIENQGVGVSVWSVAVDPGTTVESWLPAYCKTNIVDCTGFQDQAVAATMDGHAGLLVPFDAPHAFFLVDGRMYAIACWRSDDDPTVLKYSGSKRLVEAFLSTMKLLPGGPAPSMTTPGPS